MIWSYEPSYESDWDSASSGDEGIRIGARAARVPMVFNPETQQSFFTAAGTANFNQQRAFGPWVPGRTYV